MVAAVLKGLSLEPPTFILGTGDLGSAVRELPGSHAASQSSHLRHPLPPHFSPAHRYSVFLKTGMGLAGL